MYKLKYKLNVLYISYNWHKQTFEQLLNTGRGTKAGPGQFTMSKENNKRICCEITNTQIPSNMLICESFWTTKKTYNNKKALKKTENSVEVKNQNGTLIFPNSSGFHNEQASPSVIEVGWKL